MAIVLMEFRSSCLVVGSASCAHSDLNTYSKVVVDTAILVAELQSSRDAHRGCLGLDPISPTYIKPDVQFSSDGEGELERC